MNGFSERVVAAASLLPGQRVQWWGDTYRVVESVEPMGDGTDHLRVVYVNAPSARYSGHGLVRTLEVCLIEVPATAGAPVDGMCWTDA